MLQYVRDVLSHYRTQEEPKTPYSPFTEEALGALMVNLQRANTKGHE